MKSFDVVVVGGGPAGSCAGTFLAEKGLSCVILDKEQFPRDKPCGGAISNACVERYPFVKSLTEVSFCSTTLYIGDGKDDNVTLEDDKPLGHYTLRNIFDAQLIERARRAGAEIQEGVRVREIQEKPDHVEVIVGENEVLRGRYVLGADGVNSIVRKNTELAKFWDPQELSFTYVIEPVVGPDFIKETYGTTYNSHIHFGFRGKLGYGWIFPKKECLNIGFGAKQVDLKLPQIKELYQDYVRENQQAGMIPSMALPKPQLWPCVVSGGMKECATDRVLLIGDAAGFCHPITGEGILYAIWSAQIAADCIFLGLKKQTKAPEEISTLYKERCWSAFGKVLKKARKTQNKLIQSLQLVIPLAKQDPKIASLLNDLLSGMGGAWTKIKLLGRVLGAKLKKKSHEDQDKIVT